MSLKVSVIIPVYNGEKFIARAIDSVLAQTVKPFEVIVINDGSKDATAEILRQYDGKIRVLTIPNGGVSNARNTGMQMAQGNCLAFLDADDFWHATKLQRQLAVFERYPEVGFCCCNYSIYDSYRKELVDHFIVLEELDVNFNEPLQMLPLEVLLKVNFVGTCSTVLVRKQLIDQVGVFNVNYKQSEDFDLWLRLAVETPFVLLSEVLVDKKLHDTNLTNDSRESYDCHQVVLSDIKKPLGDYLTQNKLWSVYNASVSSTYYKQAEVAFNAKNYKKAFELYRLALRSHTTVKNALVFSVVFLKKLIRWLTGGMISRQNLKKLLRKS
ncbi:MAG: glycosyltransferase family 2 protein [Candidatus Omnitrophica bacterium]|nr:glycosyltransferase family 2 protein [Candidatus Omnitrophota bacterium]